jgi:dihydroorotase
MEIELTTPDDWHLHLRDGSSMAAIVEASAARFARAIIMPNLRPPITETGEALAYRRRILAALPPDTSFAPLMTLYLTDNLPPREIHAAKASGLVFAAKLYPAGATTNADSGVTRIENICATLEAMQDVDLPLLVHAEVADPEIDIFDRERAFIDRHLDRIHRDFPALRIVFEHITTEDAAEFVLETPAKVAATITPHHLLYNRNAMLAGAVRPHFYCLPILKRERHRQALIRAATGGNPKFFLGTDSAPHPVTAKECAHGCAGCYTAPAAIELYAEAFERAQALERLEAFASFHGPDFYGLPRNTTTIRLRKESWVMPKSFTFGESKVVPLRAGETVGWRLVRQRQTQASPHT